MLISEYLLLGLDSAVVGVAAAPLLPRRRTQIALAAACGVADGLASLAGGWVNRPWSANGEFLSAVLLAGYGVVVLMIAARLRRVVGVGGDPERAVPAGLSRGTLVLLPLLLSLDNLTHPTPGLGAAETIGLAVSSAALMLVGLAVGSHLQRSWRVSCLWAGGGFVLAGTIMVGA